MQGTMSVPPDCTFAFQMMCVLPVLRLFLLTIKLVYSAKPGTALLSVRTSRWEGATVAKM